MELIHAPDATVRLGDYLETHLQDQRWLEFRAAVAFVRSSGTEYLRESLAEFDARGSVRLSVGVDMFGTSREALQELLTVVRRGSVWVFHNPNSTFHPKLFVFKNRTRADVLIGSGNLTKGGLFTNYEVGLAVQLVLSRRKDANFIASIERVLDRWAHTRQGSCHRLTESILSQLEKSGLIAPEARLRIAVERAIQSANLQEISIPSRQAPGARESTALFRRVAVPPPPRTGRRARIEAESVLAEAAVDSVVPRLESSAGLRTRSVMGVSSFVMTLQNTDTGVGQTTPGTARRSPEIFIPLAALDANHAFWKFPNEFQPDAAWNKAHPGFRRNGIGKMDRRDVPMRIGVLQQVNIFFNPAKRDLRLRNEMLRSAGSVGDILWIRAVDPAMGFEYDVQVAPRGTPLHDGLEQYCTTAVGHRSQKFFGYF